jgi:chromate reductase, NAD(P)H dehydrogenase (quinone)
LKRRIREVNAILFVTPEYNWSVSGVLKNAIDWASRPHGDSAWNGKLAAIMRASTGAIGSARAQCHLRQILVYLNMFPINQPEVMISHAMDRFDQEGNLTDVLTREHIGISTESRGLSPAHRTELKQAERFPIYKD